MVIKKKKKKVVMNIEPNAKHTARATQVEKQVDKKAYTTRHTLIETGKQTRNVHEGDRGYYR